MAGLIQLWAFLREANMEVFQELRTLEVPLQSLYRITEAVQQTIGQIERATYMSRSGDQAEFLDILSSAVLVMALIVLLAESLYTSLWRERSRRRKRASMDFRYLGLNHAPAEPSRNKKQNHADSICGDEAIGSADCESRNRLLQRSKLNPRDGTPAFIYNLPLHPISLSNATGIIATPVTLPKCSSHVGIQGVPISLDRSPRLVETSRAVLPAQLSPPMRNGNIFAAISTSTGIADGAHEPNFDIRRTHHSMRPVCEVINNQMLSTPATTEHRSHSDICLPIRSGIRNLLESPDLSYQLTSGGCC
ncbi:hypothetical protein SprV_0100182600 [Sparganum proliferum]